MTIVRIDELSSRFDRSTASLRNAINRSAARADIMLLTEVAGKSSALHRHGWTVNQSNVKGLSDLAVMTRNNEWQTLRYRAMEIGPDLGPGGIVAASLALVQNRHTGETGIVSPGHLPSKVEGDVIEGKGGRAGEYRKAVTRWRQHMNEWNRLYTPDWYMICPDWNLSYRRPGAKEAIQKLWPELNCFPNVTVLGTHRGGRIIDWPAARNLDLHMGVYPPHPFSDHNAIRINGRSKSKPKQTQAWNSNPKPATGPAPVNNPDAPTQTTDDDGFNIVEYATSLLGIEGE